jgi:hypothetical protein
MNTKWQVNPEVLSSKIDEEIILMSIELDSYFGLDPVASRIWELLSVKPSSIKELLITLLEEYEIDETTCTHDIEYFIEEMSVKKLIKPLDFL